MAGATKPEFGPLLAPGRHAMTVEAVAKLCVVPFPGSVTRTILMGKLERFIDQLRRDVVVCDLWIDGSFISEKIDPEDIDLTFVVHGDVYDQLTPDLQATIDAFEDGERLRPDLHVFSIVTRPMDHPGYAPVQSLVRNVAQWWCVARGGWIKGLPVIRLGETNVGLRILP
jgi:hypothetical protein